MVTQKMYSASCFNYIRLFACCACVKAKWPEYQVMLVNRSIYSILFLFFNENHIDIQKIHWWKYRKNLTIYWQRTPVQLVFVFISFNICLFMPYFSNATTIFRKKSYDFFHVSFITISKLVIFLSSRSLAATS